MELPDQKRGRPSTLPEEILTILKKYIYAICDAGGIVNTSIVIRDFGPFLIIAYFKYFTFQVAREIIEDTRTENRF